MIHCRFLEERDRDTVLELGQAHVAERAPHLRWDEWRANRQIDLALAKANPTIFVAEEDDEVVGYLLAVRVDFAACAGFYVECQLLYVRPDKRGSRAAAKLFAGFVRWAELQRAEEIFASIWDRPSGARWLRRFGFEPAGQQMRRRVASGA